MNLLFVGGGSRVAGMEIAMQRLMIRLNEIDTRTLAVISGWNDGDYPARLRSSDLMFHETRLGRFYRSKPLWTLETLRNFPSAAVALRRIVMQFRPDVAIYVDPQLLVIGSLILPQLRNVLYLHETPSGLLTSRS